MTFPDLTTEELLAELARCRVRVASRSSGNLTEITAYPIDHVPDVMSAGGDAPHCWRGDRWVFSTVFAPVPSTVGSYGCLTAYQPEVCDLVLYGGGFSFRDADLTGLTGGLGI